MEQKMRFGPVGNTEKKKFGPITYEQLLQAFFSCFNGQKNSLEMF